MTIQWKDELETKFGLTFEMIDRERIGDLRRQRGFGVNPWATGSRFIISHRLLADESYAGDLRSLLDEFRPRALFILDEAHHAAPSAGVRHAISSQLTRAARDLAERFEHRLFLTATPHAATPTASPPCSRCLISSASPAVSRCALAISNPSWCGG